MIEELRNTANYTEGKKKMAASTGLEDVTGIRDDLMREALSMAMKAQQKSPEKPYRSHKTSSVIFFAFPGSFFEDDWFAPNNQNPFGQTTMNRNRFPCLRSISNDVDAKVNEAFLRKSETVSAHNRPFQDEVKAAVNKRKQIIFTGHSSGGATAALITVWFLENYLKTDQNQVPPRCVTFGSPLVGDHIFGHALRRENWAQYFVHFITKYDIVPRMMLAPKSLLQQSLPQILHFLNPNSTVSFQETAQKAPGFYITVMRNSSSVASYDACKLMGNTNSLLETVSSFIERSPYRPFGTCVFCTGNAIRVIVNNVDAVLQLLFYSSQMSTGEEGAQIAFQSITDHTNYENMLQELLPTNRLDCLDKIPLSSTGAHLNLSSVNGILGDLGLSATGRLCIRAAGEAEKQKAENQKKIECRKEKILEKLNWIEKSYKKSCEARKMGCYDSFRASKEEVDFIANVVRAELAGIWDEIVEMLKKYELPDGFEGKPEWINLGTKYRRLVEPLDIANYYRHLKNEDTGPYMDKARPKRYKFTQRWLEHAQWKSNGLSPEDSFKDEVEKLNRRYNLGSSQDIQKQLEFTGSKSESCLWAEVEELSGKSYEAIRVRAVILERMIERWIDEGAIGKEVLLEESAFVKWWKTLPDQHRFGSRIPELMRSCQRNFSHLYVKE